MMQWLRSPSQAGFTLVELLVVMVLLGIVGGIATTAIVTSLQSASNTNARVLALDELQTAMQRISRDLRAAEVFTINDSTDFEREITATIFRDGSPSNVSYVVEERDGVDVLVRQDTGQTLITLVDNDTVPVFTYLGADGGPIVCATNCVNEYSKAQQIRIVLMRGIEGKDPVIVESVVNVRNTRYEGNTV
jgi:prepilin-type N-terminal cleavage/methylation domain-containing protein